MNLKRLSILLSLALLSSCKSGPPPKLDIPLFAGDSANQEVRRSAVEAIKCSDPKFDDQVCMSYASLKKIFDTMWLCEQWPNGLARMTDQEVRSMLDLYTVLQAKAKAPVQ